MAEVCLNGRTQQIAYAGLVFTTHSIFFGIPQGSVLGPLLFNLYTADILAAHGLVLHQYADECQIYIATPVNETSSAVDRLTRCVNDVNAWLSASRLRLNPEKSQILWLGSKHLVSDIAVMQVPVLASSLTVADSAQDLSVVIDSCLTMSDHVSEICRSGYFQLRQLRPVARSLTADAAKMIVHAFIACRLDYCNSLLHGITDSLFRRLQFVQNAAARLIMGTRRRDRITPVLRDLHWLPVRHRVDYKLAFLVYKSLHGLAPFYLADDCILASSDKYRRRLR